MTSPLINNTCTPSSTSCVGGDAVVRWFVGINRKKQLTVHARQPQRGEEASPDRERARGEFYSPLHDCTTLSHSREREN